MSERFYEQPASDARRVAPAAARNVGPIGDVLAEWLPASGLLLELASGTGEHAIAFARRFPGLAWQPSDPNADARASIEAYRQQDGTPNVHPSLALDAASAIWPVASADAVLAINMVHISPWGAALGLVHGAARLLDRGAPLILYGPWIERDVPTAPSNQEFDADLRQRDPAWGLRTVDDFCAIAAEAGFDLGERRAMPANNLMLLYRRR